MSEQRNKSDWLIVAGLVAALVIVSLGLYVGGYFALGEKWPMATGNRDGFYRAYHHEWVASVFKPAALVETTFFCYPVETGTDLMTYDD